LAAHFGIVLRSTTFHQNRTCYALQLTMTEAHHFLSIPTRVAVAPVMTLAMLSSTFADGSHHCYTGS
jgi:hypothetical protein